MVGRPVAPGFTTSAAMHQWYSYVPGLRAAAFPRSRRRQPDGRGHCDALAVGRVTRSTLPAPDLLTALNRHASTPRTDVSSAASGLARGMAVDARRRCRREWCAAQDAARSFPQAPAATARSHRAASREYGSHVAEPRAARAGPARFPCSNNQPCPPGAAHVPAATTYRFPFRDPAACSARSRWSASRRSRVFRFLNGQLLVARAGHGDHADDRPGAGARLARRQHRSRQPAGGGDQHPGLHPARRVGRAGRRAVDVPGAADQLPAAQPRQGDAGVGADRAGAAGAGHGAGNPDADGDVRGRRRWWSACSRSCFPTAPRSSAGSCSAWPTTTRSPAPTTAARWSANCASPSRPADASAPRSG